MRLLADQNIPLVDYFFSDYARITQLPAHKITAESLVGVDVLLVRSKTKLNSNLFAKYKPAFVISCVSGTDHIDLAWLDANNVNLYITSGCNASSVLVYIQTVISCLAKLDKFKLGSHKKAGIIGIGNIGQLVANWFLDENCELVLYDPPRALRDNDFISSSWEELYDVDLLTIHIPLNTEATYPTQNLLTKDLFTKLKPGCVLINASRGGIINEQDLLSYGRHLIYCADVWQNEPELNLDLLQMSTIATPHIAGHTAIGKSKGTYMAYRQIAKQYFWPEIKVLPIEKQNNHHVDLIQLSQRLKNMVDKNKLADCFNALRNHYGAVET